MQVSTNLKYKMNIIKPSFLKKLIFYFRKTKFYPIKKSEYISKLCCNNNIIFRQKKSIYFNFFTQFLFFCIYMNTTKKRLIILNNVDINSNN